MGDRQPAAIQPVNPLRSRRAALGVVALTLDRAPGGEANLTSVIVCHCNVVSDAALVDALDDGARTLGDVCRRTGAAQECGTCVFSVRKVLCEHVARGIAPRQEATLAAS
jgi:bacterioferritin-associated ferredoxin